jgi:signal transduction histidine kinase/FixJ family two-component response regulator
MASWWLLKRQHDDATRELATRERQFHAQTLGLNLTALASRMTEVAGSTILATGLVDSAGRETYLQPFLTGIRQVNGIPVQVLFTDFEGGEIAGNNGQFTEAQHDWLRQKLKLGRTASAIFPGPDGHELVALEPLVYPRTPTPEGGLLYKVSLNSLNIGESMQLLWNLPNGPSPSSADEHQRSSPVTTPPVFGSLGFRVQDNLPTGSQSPLAPQYTSIFLLLLGLFAAVVFAGHHLATMLTEDLRQLQLFAGALVRDGLSQERADASSTEEVAGLSASINQMLDRLYEQRQALTRESEKLMELADALKRADRRKDEFVAMLAHELRNPLAPIMTGADLLLRAKHPDQIIEHTGQVISKQARHMARIIDDLLDISRITRGQVTLKLETIDLADVIAEALEQVKPMMDSCEHHLAISLPAQPTPVMADHARLVQVVSNLLNNAAKYTPAGGHLELRVFIDGKKVRMTVDDNGHGIDPELMPDIFDLFTQGERSPDRRQGGLGIGLALVKSLVQMHGGQVTASSPGPGKGASFDVFLPCAQAGHVPVGDVARGSGVSAVRPLRLHLVDDNVDAARTLAMLLEMDGYEVIVSHDGTSTLRRAAQAGERADVFVLDIGLPDMDGTELATRLREASLLQGAALVALTGYGQASDRVRFKAAGFDHHLVKPVNYAVLKDLLVELNRGCDKLHSGQESSLHTTRKAAV